MSTPAPSHQHQRDDESDNESRSSHENEDYDSGEEDEVEVDGDDGDDLIDESQCLFCNQTFKSVNDNLSHSKQQHQFDVKAYAKQQKFDFYTRIRLVNYIRSQHAQKVAPSAIISSLSSPSSSSSSSSSWRTDETYLKPFLENDPLLFGLDDDDESDEEIFDAEYKQPAIANAIATSTSTSTPTIDINAILTENGILKDRVAQLESTIAMMHNVLTRVTAQGQTDASSDSKSAPTSAPTPTPATSTSSSTSTSTSTSASSTSGSLLPTFVPNDFYYFNGYSSRDIHELMLRDTIRTDAYRDAIIKNEHLFKDKVVLDVGCGTGILSMFAARAGARFVIGVDAADIADAAREIVRKNGFSDKITIIKSKMESAVLPVSHVDVIISEWMGYFLLYESMLPSVLYARDKYLNKDGTVMPDKAVMYLCGINRTAHRTRNIDYWHNVYGFDMSNLILKEDVHVGSSVEVVPGDAILTDAQVIKSFSVLSVVSSELDFTATVTLTPTKAGAKIEAFMVWFDTMFEHDCKHAVTLGTAATQPPTHWKQTVFTLHQPIVAQKHVYVHIKATRRRSNEREYDVELLYSESLESLQQHTASATTATATSSTSSIPVFTQSYSIQ